MACVFNHTYTSISIQITLCRISFLFYFTQRKTNKKSKIINKEHNWWEPVLNRRNDVQLNSWKNNSVKCTNEEKWKTHLSLIISCMTRFIKIRWNLKEEKTSNHCIVRVMERLVGQHICRRLQNDENLVKSIPTPPPLVRHIVSLIDFKIS